MKTVITGAYGWEQQSERLVKVSPKLCGKTVLRFFQLKSDLPLFKILLGLKGVHPTRNKQTKKCRGGSQKSKHNLLA